MHTDFFIDNSHTVNDISATFTDPLAELTIQEHQDALKLVSSFRYPQYHKYLGTQVPCFIVPIVILLISVASVVYWMW